MSFEMPVLGVPLLECICWDHDRFGKDYMGEFDIALEDIFQDGQVSQQVSCREITPIGHSTCGAIADSGHPLQ